MVIARSIDSGEKQLVAYILLQEQSERASDTAVARLKSDLQEKLPAYMIPAFFVLLDVGDLYENCYFCSQGLGTKERVRKMHICCRLECLVALQ